MNYRRAIPAGILLTALFAPVLIMSERSAKSMIDPHVAAASALQSTGPGLSYYLSLPGDPSSNEQALNVVRRALQLTEDREYARALAEYDRAIELMPALADWLNVFAAGNAATLGDTTIVARYLTTLDSALLEDWGWRTRLRSYRNAEHRGVSLRFARAALDRPGSARRHAEAWRAIGEIELERNDTSAAKAAFTNTMKAWPFSDIALDAARLLADLPELNADQHLQIGRTYMRFGNSKRGLEGLNRYLTSRSADADTAQRVRYEVGRSHFDAGRHAEAVRILSQVTATTGVGSEALLLKGRAQYRNDQDALGRATFRQVAARYPDTDVAARALFLLADLEHDDEQLAAATTTFERAAATGGTSEAAGISHMRLVTLALARGDSAAAIAQLEKYQQAFIGSAREQQAAFWLGRLHKSDGRADMARERLTFAAQANPVSYYGIRANDLLTGTESTINFSPDPVTDSATQRVVNAALGRLDALYNLGWTEAAAYEIRRLRTYFTGNVLALYSLAEGLNERGRTSVGIAMGNELMRADTAMPSRRLLRTTYPLPYRELIVREARARGIDPFFMAALIRQESAFNPRATSGAGAMGLMQVMPATARGLAKPLGIRRFKPEMLHDPEINVKMGSRFLADVIRTWGGRTDYVLAAYNAGPSRMARWRRLPEARDRDLFMERIPYDETRDYVRVVQLNARIYGMLYGSEASASAGKN